MILSPQKIIVLLLLTVGSDDDQNSHSGEYRLIPYPDKITEEIEFSKTHRTLLHAHTTSEGARKSGIARNQKGCCTSCVSFLCCCCLFQRKSRLKVLFQRSKNREIYNLLEMLIDSSDLNLIKELRSKKLYVSLDIGSDLKEDLTYFLPQIVYN